MRRLAWLVGVPLAMPAFAAEPPPTGAREAPPATASAAGMEAPPINEPSNPSPFAVPVMRVGQHPGYVRVVFDLPRGSTAKLSEGSGEIAVSFSAPGPPAFPTATPPLVTAMTRAPGTAVLKLVPGVRVRPSFLDGRLVLDLLEPGQPAVPVADAPPPRAGAPARQPRPRAAPAQTPAPAPAATPAPAVAAAGSARLPAALGEHGRTTRAPGDANPDDAAGPTDGARVAAVPAPPRQPPAAARRQPPPPSSSPVPPRAAPSGPVASRPASSEPVTPIPAPRPAEPAAGDPARYTAPPPPSEAAETTEAAPAARDVTAENLPPPEPSRPADSGTLAIAAQEVPAGEGERAAMLLPFAPTIGAAAYPDGANAIIVLAERRPIDLSPLRDNDVLGHAVARLLPGATVIRLPLAAGATLRLARRPDGWRVAVVDAPGAPLAPIAQDVTDGRLRLAAAEPGDVVAVPDDQTGGTLLVGTQRASGQAVVPARRLPGFALREDWQGVVVDPVADQLTLRRTPDGFVIGADSRSLPLAPQEQVAAAQLDASRFTRRFDLPAQSAEMLGRRLDDAVAGAATAPAQARLRPRLEAAQAMLALGLGPEAQAVVHAAIVDSPRGADDPDAVALGAVAAVLAGRPDEAGGLDDPRLDGTDEIALWRGIRSAMREPGTQAAADALAAQLPLLRAYPAPLRDRLLPPALRTMALGGQAAAVTRLLPEVQTDPGLELPRALALAATARAGGDAAPALAALDALSESPDRMARARASTEAVELRLAKGQISVAQAADALERSLYAWRGGASELNLRLRVADLRRRSGQWRQAISLLRETEQFWPDRKGAIHPLLTAAFSEALSPDATAKMSPLDFVALIDENPDLLPDGEAGRALAGRIADRLLALDLPRRATSVLEKLLAATSSPEARAEIADRLAATRLAQGDAAGALDVLARTPLPDSAPEPRAHRALIFARATARLGDPAAAAAALADSDTEEALDLRATLLQQARNWPAALAAVEAYADKVLPPDGPLDAKGANILLREASMAAEAGDDAALARLSAEASRRLPPGHVADMMTLLTGKPVHGVGDLPIVAREAAVARNFAATQKPPTPSGPPPAAAR